MPRTIPFPRQAESGDMHQLALIGIKDRSGLIASIADSIRLRAMRIHRRSPVIADDLADFADEIATLAVAIQQDAETALQHGEQFLQLREEMAQRRRAQ